MFWKNLATSTFFPGRYKNLLRISLLKSIGFFFVSISILGVIQGISVSVRFLPTFIKEFQLFSEHLPKELPNDFVLEYSDGSLSIEPDTLTVSFPPESSMDDQTYRENILTYIPEDAPISTLAAQLTTSSLSILTSQNLHLNVQDEEWISIPVATLIQDENLRVNKGQLLTHVTEMATSLQNNSLVYAGIITVISSISVLFGVLWSLLIQSTMAYIFLRVFQRPISWKLAFHISLFILVALNAIDTVVMLVTTSNISMIVGFGYWIYFALVYNTLSKKKLF